MGLGAGDTSKDDASDGEEEDASASGPQTMKDKEIAAGTVKSDAKADEALYDDEGNALVVLCGLVLTRCVRVCVCACVCVSLSLPPTHPHSHSLTQTQ